MEDLERFRSLETAVRKQGEAVHRLERRADRIELRLDATEESVSTTEKTLESMNNAWQQMIGATKGANLLWDVLKVVVGAGAGALLLKVLGG